MNNLIEKKIPFNGEILTLTNQRALYWETQQALILSDLHLGKAAHFRKNGIAVPTAVSENDLQRLEELITHYRPAKVIIVGDLVHATANKEMALFTTMRRQFPTSGFLLVKGNHDRLPDPFFYKIGIDAVYTSLELNHFLLAHERGENTEQVHISGHLHPGINLRLPTEKNKRFPCFVVGSKTLILPSFTRFTGLNTQLEGTYSYFAFYEKGFIELSCR